MVAGATMVFIRIEVYDRLSMGSYREVFAGLCRIRESPVGLANSASNVMSKWVVFRFRLSISCLQSLHLVDVAFFDYSAMRQDPLVTDASKRIVYAPATQRGWT